jgi:hypothetical protein
MSRSKCYIIRGMSRVRILRQAIRENVWKTNIVNGTADSNGTFSEQCTIETISKIPPIKLGMALILGGTVDIFRTVGVRQISKPNWKGINQLSFPVGRGTIGSNILGSSISSGKPPSPIQFTQGRETRLSRRTWTRRKIQRESALGSRNKYALFCV